MDGKTKSYVTKGLCYLLSYYVATTTTQRRRLCSLALLLIAPMKSNKVSYQSHSPIGQIEMFPSQPRLLHNRATMDLCVCHAALTILALSSSCEIPPLYSVAFKVCNRKLSMTDASIFHKFPKNISTSIKIILYKINLCQMLNKQ